MKDEFGRELAGEVVLLDFGRSAGLYYWGELVAKWPVTRVEVAVPLTKKGKKIKSAMEEQYGSKKGEQVFHASKNKGTISGVEARRRKKKRKRRGY